MTSQLTQLRNLVEHLGLHAQSIQPGATRPLTELPLPLQRALAVCGLPGLERQQLEFCQLAAEGTHCALARVGPGLSLQLALLQAWSERRPGRFLWVCPDLASAHRRRLSLRRLARAAGLPAQQIELFQREAGPPHPHVLVIDAASLHRSLLPKHLSWSSWWEALALVVVDEASAYSGVRGSHVCNVLHRLERIARHYESSPTWLADYEPLADPRTLFQGLLPVAVRLLLAERPRDGWRLDLPAGATPRQLEQAAQGLFRSLDGALPEACLNPGHLVIRASHLKCAAYELPLDPDEPLGHDGLSAYFEASRTLKRETGRLYWIGVEAPASAVRLREVGVSGIQLFDAQSRKPLARIDRLHALEQIFPGAVYFHNGQGWLVEEVDTEQRRAFLRPAVVSSRSECPLAIDVRFPPAATLDEQGRYTGEAEVSLRAERAVTRCHQTGRVLDSREFHRPAELLITRCLALAVSPELDGPPEHDVLPEHGDLPTEGVLDALAELLRLALFSLVRCEPASGSVSNRPASSLSSLGHTIQTLSGRRVLILFDCVPDGSGLCGRLATRLAEVLEVVTRYLAGCACGARGCSACVGSGASHNPKLKKQLRQLIEELRLGKSQPQLTEGEHIRCL